MAHSYVSSYFHCVFSTKSRRKLMPPEMRQRLWPYLGGIARKNKTRALRVGGTDDHVHVLLSLPSTMAIAKAVQLMKGGSSKWINEELAAGARFEWQEGYGAFSVGISDIARTTEYISNQAEHHRRQTFEEEFIAFLEKHGIEYDRRYVFG